MNQLLTKKQTESLAQTLRARHEVLAELIHIELVSSADQAHVALAGTVHDTKDESLASALRDVDLKVVQMHLDELNDIASAEQRIATGTYGQCTDCGTDVGFARLTAYPTAKRCIDCQRAHESRIKG